MKETKFNDEMLIKVLDWCLCAYPRLEIHERIICTPGFEKYKTSQCDQLIEDSKRFLEENMSVESRQIITVHVGHYEKIYRYFKEVGSVDGMNKAMKAKERLLGSLNRTSKIEIQRNVNLNIKNRNVKYDLSKLTPVERDRFKFLMNKGKK